MKTLENGSKKPLHHTLVAAGITAALGLGLAACDNPSDEPPQTEQRSVMMDDAQQATSDTWITTKVKSELLDDNMSRDFNVSVETRDGVVALSGTLNDPSDIEHVKEVVSDIEGVKSVDTSGLIVSRE